LLFNQDGESEVVRRDLLIDGTWRGVAQNNVPNLMCRRKEQGAVEYTLEAEGKFWADLSELAVFGDGIPMASIGSGNLPPGSNLGSRYFKKLLYVNTVDGQR